MKLPFCQTLQIDLNDLTLTNRPDLHNHIGTLHAGAIYTLAETASGMFLSKQFGDLASDALPLLRDATIRYKHPIKTKAIAKALLDPTVAEAFLHTLEKRKRAKVRVEVAIVDESDLICAEASFEWFVQIS